MIKYIMLRHLGVTKKRQKHCKNIASAILLSKFKEFYVNLKKLRLKTLTNNLRRLLNQYLNLTSYGTSLRRSGEQILFSPQKIRYRTPKMAFRIFG